MSFAHPRLVLELLRILIEARRPLENWRIGEPLSAPDKYRFATVLRHMRGKGLVAYKRDRRGRETDAWVVMAAGRRYYEAKCGALTTSDTIEEKSSN